MLTQRDGHLLGRIQYLELPLAVELSLPMRQLETTKSPSYSLRVYRSEALCECNNCKKKKNAIKTGTTGCCVSVCRTSTWRRTCGCTMRLSTADCGGRDKTTDFRASRVL